MADQLLGIHHITAIAGDPQANVDFYAGVLGLRFVKKTVNFDDPYTYHFYFGDEIGHPGTLLTFFPWSRKGFRDRKGTNQLTVYSFSIPNSSIEFWKERLSQHNVYVNSAIENRFGDRIIRATDHDGFQFELVVPADDDQRNGSNTGSDVPPHYAIRGIHAITISERASEPTAEFMTSVLGFHQIRQEGNHSRFQIGTGQLSGAIVDLIHEPDTPHGVMGAGIIHHVAFRTPDDETQLTIRDHLVRNSISVTQVIDRNYFHSIYFNEPGGVIFEVATDPPGFLIDEAEDELGTSLKLPPQYEPHRHSIERALQPIKNPLHRQSVRS